MRNNVGVHSFTHTYIHNIRYKLPSVQPQLCYSTERHYDRNPPFFSPTHPHTQRVSAIDSMETSIAPTADKCDNNIRTAWRCLRWTYCSYH